ncbi:MAG: hypothetical protein LQ350_003045 [Teloschistes chrysophthalmus]|nr:MAG: hypothetical protein LQ350_003045 [Niorma chrysophthalma]
MDPKTLAEVKRRRGMDPRLVREEAAKEVSIFDTDYSKADQFYYRPSMNCGYNFRPGPRDPSKPQPSCDIDQDQSGTFDLMASLREASQRIPRLKRQREQEGDSKGVTETKNRPWKWRNGRRNGLSFPIVLNLTSEKGRQLLACGTNNWPGWLQSIHEANASDQARCLIPFMLPLRGVQDDGDDADIDDERVVDTSGITVGDPEARSCTVCLQFQLPCSLLQEGSTYPCRSCFEYGFHCELVIQHWAQHSCQGCRRRGIKCSYLEVDSDHTQPCRTCFAIDEKCIAGPASGRIQTGPSLDQPMAGIPESTNNLPSQRPAPKKLAKCTSCKVCNLQCEGCRIANTKGDFKLLAACTATSLLLQPVIFNYQPTKNDGTVPCHFCADPLYAIVGCQPKETSIKDPSPTHMCAGCTLDRVQILACDVHDIQEIPGKDPENVDYAKVQRWKYANDGWPGSYDDVDWEWCSVCMHEATHACCSVSVLDRQTAEEAEITDKAYAARKGKGKAKEETGKPQGCGLRLCEECATCLCQEPVETLEELLQLTVGRLKNWWNTTGVRADAELLLENGSLANFLRDGGP